MLGYAFVDYLIDDRVNVLVLLAQQLGGVSNNLLGIEELRLKDLQVVQVLFQLAAGQEQVVGFKLLSLEILLDLEGTLHQLISCHTP